MDYKQLPDLVLSRFLIQSTQSPFATVYYFVPPFSYDHFHFDTAGSVTFPVIRFLFYIKTLREKEATMCTEFYYQCGNG